MLAASASSVRVVDRTPRLVRVRGDPVERDLGWRLDRAGSAGDERGEAAPEGAGRSPGPGGHALHRRHARRGSAAERCEHELSAGLERRHPLVASAELRREVAIRLRALRLRPVQRDRQAVTGRLRQADAARDDGLVDHRSEMSADLRRDFGRQVRPGVEHREQDSLDREVRVQVVPNQVDRGGELAEALEGVVLALDRDQHRVGGGEGVDGQEAERRRAVDQDVVVAGRRSPRAQRPAAARAP